MGLGTLTVAMTGRVCVSRGGSARPVEVEETEAAKEADAVEAAAVCCWELLSSTRLGMSTRDAVNLSTSFDVCVDTTLVLIKNTEFCPQSVPQLHFCKQI